MPDSAAGRAELRPDDLIVMIDGQVVASCRDANKLIQRLENDAQARIAVLRGEEFLEFTLTAKTADAVEEDGK
jgi:hypothetical protein